MNKKYILGSTVVVIFAIVAFYAFTPALVRYVSIEEAVKNGGTVQVKGERVGNGVFDLEKNVFTFDLKDKDGRQINVIYDGPKPGNFDQATEVVCKGEYKNGAFHAREILVKCPSKYQEMES